MAEGAGSAPGKIILLGEHAVVYHHPAIAIPVREVQAQATVRTTSSPGVTVDCPDLGLKALPDETPPPEISPFADLARKTMGSLHRNGTGLEVCLRSTIPMRRGMGSGAALSVAMVRGIAAALEAKVSQEQVIALAFEAEKAFHGNPSGIDNNVVARDAPIYYTRRHGCQLIRCAKPGFRFLIADCGVRGPTADVVRAVADARRQQRAHFDALLWEIGGLVSFARELIGQGSLVPLGRCLNRNHELLRELGVSCPEADKLVQTACRAGAAGAKLSGAGRGGNVVILLGPGSAEPAVRQALLESGARDIYAAALT